MFINPHSRVLCTYMTSRREETLFEISDEPLQETLQNFPSASAFLYSPPT
ncbi:Hypothetical protein FKW44_009030 [Caligus rogercresseyi]|uniref:Uncharacterized protein n=1 Tax=Caligus rogercresseyi TaxID=217165 RepID=A0A7T8K715_CALRO|nr:Hypothetical protein FKW44_009030 [Caligus rogercresseyi]